MNDERGMLTIRIGDLDKQYELVPPIGYKYTAGADTIRVWDRDNTWLVRVEWLVALQIPNSEMGKR